MKKTRISEHISQDVNTSNDPISPRLMRGIARHTTTVSDCRPVDTYNNNIINPTEVPEVPSKGRDRNTSFEIKTKAKSVNLQLRAAFAALAEIHLQAQLSQLSFITVNLSQRDSRIIVNGGGAPFYAARIKRKIQNKLATGKRNPLLKPSFFLALEDSKDGSKHAHIVMHHHPDDQKLIASLLRKEAANHDNAVQFKTEYKLWLDAEPGSDLWELNELERDDYLELCSYPLKGQNKHGQERFYRMTPVDAGVADYISKELEQTLQDNPAASRLYIDADLRSRSRQILDERYKLKRDLKRQLPEYEDKYVQSLQNEACTEPVQEESAPLTNEPTISGNVSIDELRRNTDLMIEQVKDQRERDKQTARNIMRKLKD
jgi:hypothetical protein